jgi:hypothetical protein
LKTKIAAPIKATASTTSIVVKSQRSMERPNKNAFLGSVSVIKVITDATNDSNPKSRNAINILYFDG